MIQVLTEPPNIALSNNQVIAKFQATTALGKPYGPIGAMAEIGVSDAGFAVGNTLELSWTDTEGIALSVVFTASANPSTDNDIQSSVGGEDITYFNAIAEKIQAHPHVSPFFTILAENNQLNPFVH